MLSVFRYFPFNVVLFFIDNTTGHRIQKRLSPVGSMRHRYDLSLSLAALDSDSILGKVNFPIEIFIYSHKKI